MLTSHSRKTICGYASYQDDQNSGLFERYGLSYKTDDTDAQLTDYKYLAVNGLLLIKYSILFCSLILPLIDSPTLHDDQSLQSHDGRHSYKLALMRLALDRALDLILLSFHIPCLRALMP